MHVTKMWKWSQQSSKGSICGQIYPIITMATLTMVKTSTLFPFITKDNSPEDGLVLRLQPL